MHIRSILRIVLLLAGFVYGFHVGFDFRSIIIFALVIGISTEAIFQLLVPVLRFRRLMMMSKHL
jgi:hypothetical protein